MWKVAARSIFALAMAAGSVPERYLDAWARLQAQQPATVTETQWRQAIESAARFE
jgi:hypothetical protein